MGTFIKDEDKVQATGKRLLEYVSRLEVKNPTKQIKQVLTIIAV